MVDRHCTLPVAYYVTFLSTTTSSPPSSILSHHYHSTRSTFRPFRSITVIINTCSAFLAPLPASLLPLAFLLIPPFFSHPYSFNLFPSPPSSPFHPSPSHPSHLIPFISSHSFHPFHLIRPLSLSISPRPSLFITHHQDFLCSSIPALLHSSADNQMSSQPTLIDASSTPASRYDAFGFGISTAHDIGMGSNNVLDLGRFESCQFVDLPSLKMTLGCFAITS